MISISEILALLLIVGAAWFWWDTLRTRERAQHIAMMACRQAGVQFLDGTVALKRIGLTRNEQGRLKPLRYYAFEFSDTGAERRAGTVILAGMARKYLHMDLPEGPTITPEALPTPGERLH